MTVSKHKSESSLKHYVSKAREKKKREMSHALSEHIIPQEPAVVNNSISSDSINLENVDFLEIGNQELNNMVMSVFEQSTAITQSSTSDLHNTDSGQITCANKENGCPRYSFSNCKVVINDYGGKN